MEKLAIKSFVFLGLLASLLFVIGSHWDVFIHLQKGHTPLAKAHLVILSGLALYSLSAVLAFRKLRKNHLEQSVRKGLKLIVLGGITIPLSVVVDELWHKIFGIDMTAWSPPHLGIFAGTTTALFGIAVFQIQTNSHMRRHLRYLSFADIWIILIFAAMFFLVPFIFLDFSITKNAHLAVARPPFAYAVSSAGVTAFLLVLTATTLRRIGTASIAAFVGLVLYIIPGFLIGTISVEPNAKIIPPFPFLIAALALDLWLFVSLRKRNFPLSFLSLAVAVFVAATVSYWTLTAWALWYGNLPQQLQGGPKDWLFWYIVFVPIIITIFASLVISLLGTWAGVNRKKNEVAKN